MDRPHLERCSLLDPKPTTETRASVLQTPRGRVFGQQRPGRRCSVMGDGQDSTVELSGTLQCATRSKEHPRRAHAQPAVGALLRDPSQRRHADSTASVATCASADDGPLGALVAAFPQPPSQSASTPAICSPTLVPRRKGSLRPSLPPAGPPPTAPLPPPPTPTTLDVRSLAEGHGATSPRGPPALPLPPMPPAAKRARGILGLVVPHLTEKCPLSPTAAAPSLFSFSPYSATSIPSPTSPEFSEYTLLHGGVHVSQKPLPALPHESTPAHPHPPSPASPRTAIPAALAGFSFARAATRVPPENTPPLVESPVEMHNPLPNAPHLSQSSPPRSRSSPRRRTCTASTSSWSLTANRLNRSSLDMENITAELSLLADSFRPNARSVLPDGQAACLSGSTTGDDAGKEEDEDRALLRRVGSTVELKRRKAYKLTRRPSFLSSPALSHRRTSSTSSTVSSSSSSEAEELFDLSFDTPSTSPALKRDGFAWSPGSSSVRPFGRRQSSATTVDSVDGRKADFNPGFGFGDDDDEVEVLASSAMRRVASSDPPRPADAHTKPTPSSRLYLTPPSATALPRPAADRPLSSARSSPHLRRLPVPVAARSPLLQTSSSTAPPCEHLSAGAHTPPLPPASEPDSDAVERPAPPPKTTKLPPLVTVSAARTAPAPPAAARASPPRLPAPTPAPAPSCAPQRPLFAGSALRLPTGPITGARTSSLPRPLVPGTSAGRVRRAAAGPAAHGRQPSLQTLPYLADGRSVSTADKESLRLPKR